LKYSVTTPDPGAKIVLINGATLNPLATAFYAISPAATNESGFEVFVQLVIAATTTLPLCKV
jgi:hypothetical protein